MAARWHVDGELQDLARATGCVSDSRTMSRFGSDHAAKTLVVTDVRFMGDCAKILSPGKPVLMPDLDATCWLDLGYPPDAYATFCDVHPDRSVVVYACTSAAVKARADWMVTISCALAIAPQLKDQGQNVLWVPGGHLGRDIQKRTGADMQLWDGACIVHDEFKDLELDLVRLQHPDAQVLAHPASPRPVVTPADVVGSTSQLLKAVVDGSARVAPWPPTTASCPACDSWRRTRR